MEEEGYEREGFEDRLMSSLLSLETWCLGTRFTALWEAFAARGGQEVPTLASILTQHPGLEHTGGVPVGGTLVVVYDDGEETGDTRAAAAVEAIASKWLAKNASVAGTWAGGRTLASLFEFGIAGTDGARIAELYRGVELDPTPRLVVNPVFDDLLTAVRDGLSRRGTVVADFSLPYRCCGDQAARTSYIVTHEITVRLGSSEYCRGEDGPFPFVVSPVGGVVTGPGVRPIDGGFGFVPSDGDVPVGPVEFTYTLGSQTATYSIEVTEEPTAAFSFVADGDTGRVTFTNKSRGASGFLWEFGQQDATSTEEHPEHEYDLSGGRTFVVKLTASHGGL